MVEFLLRLVAVAVNAAVGAVLEFLLSVAEA
jgi:hypothetical protein